MTVAKVTEQDPEGRRTGLDTAFVLGGPLALGATAIPSLWRRNRQWLLIAAVILVVLVVAAIRMSRPPSGPSASALQRVILGDVRGRWATPAASIVTCVMPARWAAGSTGTCYVYDRHSTEVGTVAVTVLPTQGGTSHWNELWRPAP